MWVQRPPYPPCLRSQNELRWFFLPVAFLTGIFYVLYVGWEFGWGSVYVDVSLREWYLNIVFFENFVYGKIEFTHGYPPFICAVHPVYKFKVERIVSEFFKAHNWFGILPHHFMIFCRFQQAVLNRLQLRAVGNTYIEMHPHQCRRLTPVYYIGFHQLGVRHYYHYVVRRMDGGAPGAYSLYYAASASFQHNDVPNLDRSLEEKDNAAKKVVYYMLQTEADTDTQGTGEEGKAPYGHPGYAHGKEHGTGNN